MSQPARIAVACALCLGLIVALVAGIRLWLA
jgi:hypothetical protein